MAINDILEEIKKQAEKEIAGLDAERDTAISKITKDSEEKRTHRKKEMDNKISENVNKVKSRAETFAKMETRNNSLRAKREILTQVFGKTVQSLIDSDKYVEMVTALLKTAAKEFDNGTIQPAKGKESETKAALEKSGTSFTLSPTSSAIQGGFILESGKIEVNFSFEAILGKEVWDELELELNKLLFP
jgi:vacuolar-type H+-ATPase subunit E/Vma4